MSPVIPCLVYPKELHLLAMALNSLSSGTIPQPFSVLFDFDLFEEYRPVIIVGYPSV